MRRTVAAAGAILLVACATGSLRGQEAERPAGRAATAPSNTLERLPDGQPNVQGLWAAVSGSTLSLTNPIDPQADFERQNVRRPSRIIDPPDGLVPYQPWAAARQKQQGIDYAWPTKPEHIDTQHRCLLSGVPRLYLIIPSFKIIQARESIVFVWDSYHAYRVIPLDGRPHVASNVKLWMGDGRGHWEGNTLVIDTTNVKGARLSFIGDFYSDNAHIVERLNFVDTDNMIYEATIDDPTVFTRPWTMRVAERRRPDEELWESACYEGAMDPDEFLIKSPASQK
jgi:hypothetical protein